MDTQPALPEVRLADLPALPGGVVPAASAQQVARATEWTGVRTYAQRWADEHAGMLRDRGGAWAGNPLTQWSRRWEYPYALQALAAVPAGGRVLDAGSGFTFFPYLVADALPGQVICVDRDDLDERYVSSPRAGADVRFTRGDLTALPVPAGALDAVTCISVLEHMPRPEAVVEEFHRVLKPGGTLVVTLDLSLDGYTQIPVTGAQELVRRLATEFEPVDADALRHADAAAAGVLTTRRAGREDRALLPWTHPRLYGGYARLRAGRLPWPRTLELACFCATFRRR